MLTYRNKLKAFHLFHCFHFPNIPLSIHSYTKKRENRSETRGGGEWATKLLQWTSFLLCIMQLMYQVISLVA